MATGGRSDVITAVILIAALILVVILLSSGLTSSRTPSETAIGPVRSESVGLVEIIGVIWDSREWVRQIDRFRSERNIRAVVVRIDSPGGTVAPSQELYSALLRTREEKPVIVSMGGVAASGAYYAALAADTIVANPGTTTGSIGVLIEFAEFSELLEKIGISSEVVKSGEFKDTGNPMRRMTGRERAYLQDYIDDATAQFVQTVADERGLELREVRKISDGRVFTGRQALELGLVDILGDQHEAIRIAGLLTGLGAEPPVVKARKRRGRFDWIEYLIDESTNAIMRKLEAQPVFQYRWRPEEMR